MSITQNAARFAQYAPKRRNLLVNGDFTISQRGDSFTSPANGAMVADMWGTAIGGAVVINSAIGRSLTGARSPNYLSYDVTTADVSIAASDLLGVRHHAEGYDLAHLSMGSADAQTVTLSFTAAHTKTGTYCVAFRNGTADRHYIMEYEQVVSDAWETHEFTVQMDTTGTWDATTGVGLQLFFSFMGGTTYQSAPGVWAAGNKFCTTNQVNAADSTANFCRLSAVQLEIGTDATDFNTLPYTEVLAQCQRYFWRVTATLRLTIAQYNVSYAIAQQIMLPVTMRAVPTVAGITPTWFGYTGTPGTLVTAGASVDGLSMQWNWSGGTAGYAHLAVLLAGVTVDAEL